MLVIKCLPCNFALETHVIMTTLYFFYNECLGEEFKFLFVMRKESLTDYVLLQSIKEEIYSSKWDRENFIIGEPLDPSFPIIELREGVISLIERPDEGYNPNGLSFQLDSMKI